MTCKTRPGPYTCPDVLSCHNVSYHHYKIRFFFHLLPQLQLLSIYDFTGSNPASFSSRAAHHALVLDRTAGMNISMRHPVP